MPRATHSVEQVVTVRSKTQQRTTRWFRKTQRRGGGSCLTHPVAVVVPVVSVDEHLLLLLALLPSVSTALFMVPLHVGPSRAPLGCGRSGPCVRAGHARGMEEQGFFGAANEEGSESKGGGGRAGKKRKSKVVQLGLGRGLGYDVAASRSPGRFICVRVESTAHVHRSQAVSSSES
jgi:hypothetical protein